MSRTAVQLRGEGAAQRGGPSENASSDLCLTVEMDHSSSHVTSVVLQLLATVHYLLSFIGVAFPNPHPFMTILLFAHEESR